MKPVKVKTWFAQMVLASALLACPHCMAKSDYEVALDLYSHKQYASAAQYFEAASLHNPGNPSINYYAGYSFYLAGRKNEAIASFKRLVSAFPSTKEGFQARVYLKSLDPNYEKESALPNTTSSAQQHAAVKPPTAREIVEQLVQVKATNGKFANVTPAFVEKVKGILVAMPISVLAFWQANGGTVVIAPSVVETDYRIQNTVPRGWDQDSTWKDSPALTHGKQVVVSQYKSKNNEDNGLELGVVRHEAGHAIDYCLGYITQSTEYKHAYYLDYGKVPDEHKKRLDYFLQKGNGGPSETFAELFCYRMGGETDTGRVEICELVHKDFPLCDAELGKSLTKLARLDQ
ncbi:MAG: hypothetical protein JST89_03925 [Cyanobacteria bacterium SZAS-4]|nr:hypothetical protein [Cyanobacteria bacterium SZAS-4]